MALTSLAAMAKGPILGRKSLDPAAAENFAPRGIAAADGAGLHQSSPLGRDARTNHSATARFLFDSDMKDVRIRRELIQSRRSLGTLNSRNHVTDRTGERGRDESPIRTDHCRRSDRITPVIENVSVTMKLAAH